MDRIDLIYDRHVAAEKLKHGTKYERLAAIVFKTLNRDDTVIHDLRLRGAGKRTAHQIDVTIERGGRRQRLIIECRHLFSSSRRSKIKLGAVRDFHSVVRAVEADGGLLLTTTGFTEPARTYAEEEGVQLGVLRPFEESDRAGRLMAIHNTVHLQAPGDFRVTTWLARDDAERERVQPLLAGVDGREYMIWLDETWFYDDQGQPDELFSDALRPIVENVPLELGPNSGEILFDQTRWIRLAGHLIAVRGFCWEQELSQATWSFTVGAGDKVAELLLKLLDGSFDGVIWDRDLSRFSINPDGEVVERRAA